MLTGSDLRRIAVRVPWRDGRAVVNAARHYERRWRELVAESDGPLPLEIAQGLLARARHFEISDPAPDDLLATQDDDGA
jgi:hypothetical protein